MGEEKLEYHVGGERIRQIAEYVGELRQDFKKALKYTTEGRVENYLNSLETLYIDIRGYVDNDEWKQQTEEKLRELRGQVSEDPEQVFQDAKKLDKEINDRRMEEGLDIPSKTSADPENAALEGLKGG